MQLTFITSEGVCIKYFNSVPPIATSLCLISDVSPLQMWLQRDSSPHFYLVYTAKKKKKRYFAEVS